MAPTVTVGAPVPAGMQPVLARMGRPQAGEITKNRALRDAFMSFMGDQFGQQHPRQAEHRMKQIAHLTSRVTNLASEVKSYGNMVGMDKSEQRDWYTSMLETIGGGPATASMFGETNPLSMQFADEDFGPQDWLDRKQAKYKMAQYITSNLKNPSPQFSQEMVMTMTLPIAKALIPNTVFLKAFITDDAVNEIGMPYVLKRRYPAFQQGLFNDVAQQAPAMVQQYNPILITPSEWFRVIALDLKWIETLNFDVAADTLADGGRELQVLLDSTAFKGLDALMSSGTLTADAKGTNTNGFKMDSTGTVMILDQGINPSVEHILFAAQVLRNRGYRPDLLITSPFELGVMMSQQAVLMAYAFGNREVQETGMVGQLAGQAVAWTPNLWLTPLTSGGTGVAAPSSYVMYLCDSNELARTVLGYPITLFPNFVRRRVEFELYTRLALFYRNVNSAVKIVCSNTSTGIT